MSGQPAVSQNGKVLGWVTPGNAAPSTCQTQPLRCLAQISIDCLVFVVCYCYALQLLNETQPDSDKLVQFAAAYVSITFFLKAFSVEWSDTPARMAGMLFMGKLVATL